MPGFSGEHAALAERSAPPATPMARRQDELLQSSRSLGSLRHDGGRVSLWLVLGFGSLGVSDAKAATQAVVRGGSRSSGKSSSSRVGQKTASLDLGADILAAG